MTITMIMMNTISLIISIIAISIVLIAMYRLKDIFRSISINKANQKLKEEQDKINVPIKYVLNTNNKTKFYVAAEVPTKVNRTKLVISPAHTKSYFSIYKDDFESLFYKDPSIEKSAFYVVRKTNNYFYVHLVMAKDSMIQIFLKEIMVLDGKEYIVKRLAVDMEIFSKIFIEKSDLDARTYVPPAPTQQLDRSHTEDNVISLFNNNGKED